jgi:hypothetical protein
MRLSACLLLAVTALLAAGCDTEPSVYKAAPTAECLRDHDYDVTTDPAELGIVERTAPNGGLIASKPGNAFRVSFAENSDAARGLEHAYTVFASKKIRPHITDVLRTQKNAVFRWTVTPTQDEIDEVFGCLKG